MSFTMPYFMTNKKWYTECDSATSPDGLGYHLTNEAPQEAIDSYNEFIDTNLYEIDPETEEYKLDENGNKIKIEGWVID